MLMATPVDAETLARRVRSTSVPGVGAPCCRRGGSRLGHCSLLFLRQLPVLYDHAVVVACGDFADSVHLDLDVAACRLVAGRVVVDRRFGRAAAADVLVGDLVILVVLVI